MIENLIFCLNATVPVFLLMLLGMGFMRTSLFDEAFVSRLNTFVFKIALPVLLFYDLAREDFYSVWDTEYVVFCFCATALSVLLVTLVSYAFKRPDLQGEFIQVAYRSSAAILGITIVENLYGSAGMTPLMIIGTVPLYNIMAVTVLSFFKPDRKPLDKALFLKTGKSILTNPIIIGVFAGLFWSLFKFPMPTILDKTIEGVARLATPLGVIAMGASFKISKAKDSIKPAVVATFFKLFGLAAIFLPIAIALGFTHDKLVAALIMTGSPTTVSCFVMAKNMGHEGTLTSSTVMLATLFSAFSLTGWLFVLRSFGLI